MSQSAKVTSIDAVKEYKAGLCRFVEEAGQALSVAQVEIGRATEFLNQQMKFWKMQVRKCEEKIVQAQADLRKKKMSGVSDRPPDSTEEEKALRMARERHRYAEEKVRAVQKWGPRWQKAMGEYQGPARQLASMLELDGPQAIAALDAKIDALDKYVGDGE